MAKKNPKSKPATKGDIDKLQRQIKERSTHRDLELWGGQLQHQMQEFQHVVEKKIETSRQELAKLIREEGEKTRRQMSEDVEGYVEHKAADLLGVTGDEVKLMQDKQADHEERLTKVEKTIGVR
jgi:hypothetical protein